MNKPELLIPAGGLETLKVAVSYGADAVYIGGNRFGLRAKADNFTHEDMVEARRITKEAGVKLYVTTNIYAHNEDIEKGTRVFRRTSRYRCRCCPNIRSRPVLDSERNPEG